MKLKSPLILTLLLATGLAAAAQDVRLALVPADPSAAAAADVLSAQLSSAKGVALLERTQVQKVLREQATAAANGGQYLKLGQVLGADGLLLLAFPSSQNRTQLVATLVAVKPGAILRQCLYPWPQDNPAQWADLATKQFQPLLPKLAVLRKDAVPISILNLRAAVRSPVGVTQERELTTLLQHRLAQERDVFLLERRRMDLLLDEKFLAGLEDQTFWNGSYLLEGLIDKDGYQPATVTISGRLVPPDKQAATAIEISGPRTNLPIVVSELVNRILATLKKPALAAEWKSEAEAAQYEAEAQWAMKWGLWREAQSASEASWALGRQTKEVAELRVRAWRATGTSLATCIFERETGRVKFGRPFQLYQIDGRQMANFLSVPDPERFADLLRAAALYEDGWQRFAADDPQLDPGWLGLGNSMLEDLSLWLRHYYFMTEARAGMAEQLVGARQAAGRLYEALTSHPAYGQTDTNRTVLRTMANYAFLWSETPEATVAAYRKIMAAGGWPEVRSRFLNEGMYQAESQARSVGGSPAGNLTQASPPLGGWAWAERKRSPDVWQQFIEALSTDPQPLNQIEGRYLRCSSTWTPEDFERRLGELLESAAAQWPIVVQSNRQAGWLRDLKALALSRSPHLTDERRKRIEGEIWPSFERQLSQTSQPTVAASGSIAEAKAYFEKATSFSVESFNVQQQRKYTAGEARELLPLVRSYRQRMMTTLPPASVGQALASSMQFEAALRRIIMDANVPARSPANLGAGLGARPTAPSRPPTGNPGPTAGAPTPAGAPEAWSSTTSVFASARFWAPPLTEEQREQFQGLRVTDARYREGQLWVDILGEDRAHRAHGAFFRIDPSSLKSEVIELPAGTEQIRRASWAELGQGCFEVHQGWLYARAGLALRRYSLKEHRWEDPGWPVDGVFRLARIGSQLYITTSDSILRVNADNAGIQVLASSRRRPAVTALDALPELGVPPVFGGPDGALQAVVAGKVWRLPAGAQDWAIVAEVPGGPAARLGVFEDAMLVTVPSNYQEQKVFGLLGAMPDLEPLFVQAPSVSAPSNRGGPMMGGFPRPSRPAPASSPARWALPPGAQVVGRPMCLEGDKLWGFVGTLVVERDGERLRMRQENGRQGLLIRFAPDAAQPMVGPLRLELPNNELVLAQAAKLVGSGSFGETLFHAIPDGLVLTHYQIPGFWLITHREATDTQDAAGSPPPAPQPTRLPNPPRTQPASQTR
jgi:hypothetical protein